jgi:anti-anti-sigma factor
MKIQIREKEGVAILDLEGNIDINASNFVETTGWVLTNMTTDIICNFESVNLVDYVGISLIAVVYKNILNHNGRIKLYNVPSHVMKLFFIVGLDRVFEYYMSEEQALGAIQEEKTAAKLQKKHLRRRFKRIPFNATIEYKPKFSQKEQFSEGKIINLSADGVFVLTDRIYSIGDLLHTRMNLMPQPGIIEIDTKVVWIADRDMQPHDYPGMALEFHNIQPKEQEKIVQFVERHLTHSAQEFDE